jgi:hypothetical protein
MNKTDGKDRAFARSATNQGYGSHGITKREYFAAIALQGLMANSHITERLKTPEISILAIRGADALIDALNKED